MKTCSKCGLTLPSTPEYFYRNKDGKDGLRSACKACVVKYNHEAKPIYHQANREKITQYNREYHANNRERLNQRRRERRKENHEKEKQSQRERYKKNHEKVRKMQREWHKANPEYRRINQSRRRARKRLLPNNYTHQDWLDCLEYFNYCCAVCGSQLRDLFGNVEPHADHWIPLASEHCTGTVVNNMICLCNACNLSKNDKLPEQWLDEKFGKASAAKILKRIKGYFEWATSGKD